MLQREYLEQARNSMMGSNEEEKQDDQDLSCCPVFLSLESLIVPTPTWLRLSSLFPNLQSLEVNDMDDWSYDLCVLLDYEGLSKVHPRLNRLHTPERGTSHVVEGGTPFFDARK
jgi:hypothetical protein